MKMKNDRKYKKIKTDYIAASRKRKDVIINVMVLSIAGFIAVLLISNIV